MQELYSSSDSNLNIDLSTVVINEYFITKPLFSRRSCSSCWMDVVGIYAAMDGNLKEKL